PMSSPVVLLVHDPNAFRERIRVRLRDLGYRTQVCDLCTFFQATPLSPDGLLVAVPAGRGREVWGRLSALLSQAGGRTALLYRGAPRELPGLDLGGAAVRLLARRDPERDLDNLLSCLYQSLPWRRSKALSS